MPPTVPIGRFALDPLRHTLSGADAVVQLSPLASRFLQVLAREPGAVVERGVLIDELWRGDYLVGEPALNRVVSETRRAVGDSPKDPALIQTVHRRGYRLVAEATLPVSSSAERLLSERWAKIWFLAICTVVALGGVTILILAMTMLMRFAR